jgi:hypothetical protein
MCLIFQDKEGVICIIWDDFFCDILSQHIQMQEPLKGL